MANCTCIKVSGYADARELSENLIRGYREQTLSLGWAGMYYSSKHPWIKLSPFGYSFLGKDDSDDVHELAASMNREVVMLCAVDPIITYTHFLNGQRVRHLASCSERGWLEIEGEPEQWEGELFQNKHIDYEWAYEVGTATPFWDSHARQLAAFFSLPGFIDTAPEGYWQIELPEII